jgi:hypothetical protein
VSNAQPVLLDPPNWPGLSNDQLTVFVESVNSLLDYGIFRPPLATEFTSTEVVYGVTDPDVTGLPECGVSP